MTDALAPPLAYDDAVAAGLVADALAEVDADELADRARLLTAIKSGTWLDGQDFPPLRYAVDGLLPEGLTLFVGPPKVGKSWLLLGMALAVAAGGHALERLSVDRRCRGNNFSSGQRDLGIEALDAKFLHENDLLPYVGDKLSDFG